MGVKGGPGVHLYMLLNAAVAGAWSVPTEGRGSISRDNVVRRVPSGPANKRYLRFSVAELMDCCGAKSSGPTDQKI